MSIKRLNSFINESNAKTTFIFEGENLGKLVNYAKSNPEIGDAIGLAIKKFIAKVNPNVASIINSTVKETGVNKQKLIDALKELGFTELTGEV